MIGEACQGLVDAYCDEKTYPEEWDLDGLPCGLPRPLRARRRSTPEELRREGPGSDRTSC